jgi:PAS domain S-box-containing protein
LPFRGAVPRCLILEESLIDRPSLATPVAGHEAHVVQFYETDEYLADVVARFLAEALAANEAAVVIATEAHRAAFAARLRGHGIDVEGATAAGRLLLLDAAETLATFMVGGMPDWQLFKARMESVLDSLGRPLGTRAYGEMVDILWRAGNSQGALRLEEMWNDLQRERSFSLLCAYVMASFYKEGSGLHRVCATHSAVRPAEPAANTLAAEIAQRIEVEQALRDSIRELRAKEQALATSEAALRDFVDNANVGLHWVDADGIILWANRAELALLGYQPEEYIGRSITEFHVDAGRIADVLDRLRADEELRNHEAQMRCKDGSIKHVLVNSTVYRENGAFIHTRCFTRDVTERADAEQAVLESQRQLQTITDTLPQLISYVDTEQRYRFVNKAYEGWTGRSREVTLGRPIRDVVGEATHDVIKDHVERALAGEPITYQTEVPFRTGVARFVEATYLPHRGPDGRVHGFIALITDISERKRLEERRDEAERRNHRLLRVTAAIADAVTSEQVFEAIVDQVAAAIAASGAALWIVDDDGRTTRRVRAIGSGDHGATPPDGAMPIVVQGRTLGSVVYTFDGAEIEDDERSFLQLVVRYSGQALERLRLFRDDQRARLRAELLYGLARAVIAADGLEAVFDAALDAIERALGTGRASILVCDRVGVMRFQAWRGLSEGYRRAVDGHSPWARDAGDVPPIVVPDVRTDPAMASYLPIFEAEAIGALAFIPLVAGHRLLGKFMVYYETARELDPSELDLARAIADHVAAAIARFGALADLRETVRFNEMFTGILGHDLRNPLGAIVTAAQLAMMRNSSEKLNKPLSRILSSGERMARMIEQLLDFTRVRLGDGVPMAARPVDIVPMVRQVIDELDDANPEWALRLDHLGDTSGAWDVDRLAQVFSNLVANAVQHGEPGDGVRVLLDGSRPQFLQIEIHNQGTIPAELVPRLFEPLSGGQRRMERSRGLGLGLYITREIVKAHGGTIDVRSDETSGTTFSITLPR